MLLSTGYSFPQSLFDHAFTFPFFRETTSTSALASLSASRGVINSDSSKPSVTTIATFFPAKRFFMIRGVFYDGTKRYANQAGVNNQSCQGINYHTYRFFNP